MADRKKFRILSIDGGGLRGIIPVLMLKHIEAITGKRIYELFDFVAGTSTGALIACGLTLRGFSKGKESKPRYTVEQLEQLYVDKGRVIFPVGSAFHAWWRSKSFSYMFRPQFSNRGIRTVLSKLFYNPVTRKQSTIKDCMLPLLISTYDLSTNSPVFFKSRKLMAPGIPQPGEVVQNPALLDICLATSAGPTYLPPHTFKYEHAHQDAKTKRMTCIDGGVVVNNPTLASYVEVLKHKAEYERPDLEEKDIYVLSLGTGHFSKNIAGVSHRWGKLNWAAPVVNIAMWGGNQCVDYQAAEILKFGSNQQNYLRMDVNIMLEKYADMANSDARSVSYLRSRFTKDYLNNGLLQDSLNAFLERAGVWDTEETLV